MTVIKNLFRGVKAKEYADTDIITLTGKELNELKKRYELNGRRKMFTFWNEYFCNCEVNNHVRETFKLVDSDLTKLENKLSHVQI